MPKPVSKKKVTVDFAGVESGGGSRAIPDGRYVGEVKKVVQKEGESSGKPYLNWLFNTLRPHHKGAGVYHNTSLQPQALFNLKNLLEAMGVDVDDGEMELALEEYVDMEVGYEIVNEEYQGKQKPQIVAFFPPDELEEGEAEEEPEKEADEEEAPKKGIKSAFKKGSKIQFDDEDGRTKKGVITSIDGDEVTVDVKGEEWTVELSDLSAQD
jgi:hypothetical protein